MSALPYEVVIGLEVHVQLLTKSKLFCGCRNEFGLPPNSATCPVCIGMPGVLPVMNREAFELALKAALALNCEIAPFTKWDRKNYYYPDLPKNYQISQYDLPFSRNGWLEIDTAAGPKKIGLIRVHLEEDAGKMLHDETGQGRDSLVDLNRAGTPLLEIVTRPDMNSPEEARLFLEEIRLLLRELKVSDCEMQEGSLRVDANVNIHIPQADGGFVATPIVEVKNLNSFRAVEKAMAYEAQRQYEEYQQTGKKLGEVPKATAGWDETLGMTVVQRRKEEASDYRYFPEPDLVPVVVDEAWRERIRASLGELPAARRCRFQNQYGLSVYDARVIISQGLAFADYFEELASLVGDAKVAANWCTNQVLQVLNERQWTIAEFPLRPSQLAELLEQVRKYRINPQRARDVFMRMIQTGTSAEVLVRQMGLDVTFDIEQLRQLVRQAIANNPKALADVRSGKAKAIDALVGPVMRATQGKAPTDVVRQLLQEELQKA
ncbi:MAG: Asp-tRNA(Asn)/Glu-tRNA(Gln) amidotransferase GatCAB subunit B [Gemmataceae bacterium]